MRLAIFGGTGGTGLELTRQALEQGHNVRVLVRNPNRMPLVNPNMRVVLGNVLDHESVTKTRAGSGRGAELPGTAQSAAEYASGLGGTQLIMDVMKAAGSAAAGGGVGVWRGRKPGAGEPAWSDCCLRRCCGLRMRTRT